MKMIFFIIITLWTPATLWHKYSGIYFRDEGKTSTRKCNPTGDEHGHTASETMEVPLGLSGGPSLSLSLSVSLSLSLSLSVDIYIYNVKYSFITII